MHASSFENMTLCYRRFVQGTFLEHRGATVLDVGGADVNGSYRAIFPTDRFTYRMADVADAPGTDIVLRDPYTIPLADSSVDVVISGQAFEHIEFFWRTFEEMVRVLKKDGVLFLIAPSAGIEHRYPVDCYRFYRDAYSALARFARCELVEAWQDERGPWKDLVGVFRHTGAPPLERTMPAPVPEGSWDGETGSPEEEATSGRAPYLDVLRRFHDALQPTSYLEIGVRNGASLSLARGSAIGVDPFPHITHALPPAAIIDARTSDEFFKASPPGLVVDLAFIDGLHLFEQALRDFMHVERIARPGAALLVDDVCPNHPAQARRMRKTQAWTGDVWKLSTILRAYRPDLFLRILDTHPTGMLLVAGLDPSNRLLWDQYNPIVRQFSGEIAPPPDVIERTGAVDPTGPELTEVLGALAGTYRPLCAVSPGAVVDRLQHARPTPKLSVVIVAYNMERELPRTIRSLSPDFQRGIEANDYELILLDNGSTVPIDEEALQRLAPNLTIHRVPDATPSPVVALNRGIRLAKGDLVGTWIDGARMASPGLLASALRASRLHARPVLGTLSFHLGPAPQPASVGAGYDTAIEDALLASIEWERDGYRLFEISTFAGSSKDGWFEVPAESNAVFMPASVWHSLGGFDPGFVAAGGGLANLDLWRRACEDSEAALIMLLGEGTFHQVHGGVATNSVVSPWEAFHEEYVRLRGRAYEKPTRAPLLVGTMGPHAVRSLLASSDTFAARHGFTNR